MRYTETAAATFDYLTDWKEQVADNGPAGTIMSSDQQTATLVGYVPWAKQRSCARYFLGFAYTEGAPAYRLRRENPQAHPIWPQLYASAISFSPLLVEGNEDNPSFEPYDESPFINAKYAARYKYAVATVSYTAFRQNFLDDELIDSNTDEWRRNTFFDPTPRIEALTCDGISQLTFAEIGAGGKPPANTRFPAPIAQLMAKTNFTLVWTNVPWEYLSTDYDIFYPTKILSCVGKVNSAVMFAGFFPIGTILMQPPTFSIKSSYVPSTDITYPNRFVDVALNFEYFDPDKGVPASAYRGHRLMPWRGETGDALSGKWFYATRGGATTDEKLLPEADLMTVFEHVSE